MYGGLIIPIVLRGGGAAIWFGFVWVLTQAFAPDELGRTLFALTLIAFGASLATAGWAQFLLRDGSRAFSKRDNAFFNGIACTAELGVLKCVAFLALVGFALYITDFAPHLLGTPLIGGLTILCAGLHALLIIRSTGLRAMGNTTAAMFVQFICAPAITTCITAVTFRVTPPSTAVVLTAYFLGLVPIVIWLGQRVHRKPIVLPPMKSIRPLMLGQYGQIILSHLDVIALGWLLTASDAAAYLIARRFAGLTSLIFDALRLTFSPLIARQIGQTKTQDVAHVANRAFFVCGAGVGLIMVACAPLALSLFDAPDALLMFNTLLFANLSPAIFGASGILMIMNGMEQARATTIWLFLPVALLILIVLGTNNGFGLASAVLFNQAFLGLMMAALLIRRFKIWPGPILFLVGAWHWFEPHLRLLSRSK